MQNTPWMERSLAFDFSQARLALKFDDPQWHGLTHGGLSCADFLVEWDDQLWLIEIKDPESAPENHRDTAIRKFTAALDRKTLITQQLAPTLRDSLFYLWFDGWQLSKPIQYLVVIGLESMSPQNLSVLRNTFLRETWLQGPTARGWKQPLNVSVNFLTVSAWNALFPHCPITRISEN